MGSLYMMRGSVSRKCLDFVPTMAAGGALMNKNYTEAYALIEDMAQNHYQWTNERAIIASTPSKKEAGMYEVSNYDHLVAKVDALTQKFEKT
ncbi:hypothetical protein MTR_7g033360 [Medicago truncatula]|uniref:Uncharacterized protein n=1 Tax=Medicago truncatula TaxID=3880 RepID=A0A072TY46_MEDTR|nr:hypothetical protein MTR_7g033360 [Medicago truncatula]